MAFLTNLSSLFAQQSVQAIAAGLIAGVVGGTALVATGIIPVGGTQVAASTVALLACPDSGPVLAQIPNGQAMLVTARSADGSWLQVYVGQPGVDRGWAPADSLDLQSPAEDLPVADCAGPTPAPLGTPTATAVVSTPSPGPTPPPTELPSAAPTPSAGPTPSPSTRVTPRPTTRVTPRPTIKVTPKPTVKPTTNPTPTPFVDTTPPSLSNLTADGFFSEGAYYIFGPSAVNCPPHSSQVSVTAMDPDDPVDSVTLFYWPGNSGVLSKQMMQVGPSTWRATIDAADGWSDAQFPNDPNGLINYWVQATDSNGNVSGVLDHSNSYRLYSGVCFN